MLSPPCADCRSTSSPRMTTCLIIDLGLIGYAEAYALQKRIVAGRKADAIENVLLLCEHSHVITQGRNGKRKHLRASENEPRRRHHLSRPGPNCRLSDPESRGHPPRCSVVRAYAGRSDDSGIARFRCSGDSRGG